MKTFIKIAANDEALGNGKMLYSDSEGNQYLGSAINAPIGSIVCVEVSSGKREDGHVHIVKVVGVVGSNNDR